MAGYADTYELQVTLLVLTHTPPAVAPERIDVVPVVDDVGARATPR
ncbi:hypothetical protein ACI79G_12290 [Geodermatophilus sp. SYSU D00779]